MAGFLLSIQFPVVSILQDAPGKHNPFRPVKQAEKEISGKKS